jgi:AcrR family transcriptional regulator
VAETRDLILDAAERLYAERGINGVSLREITEAAGQRNNAAVHYHFGGRDGLVRALFEHRYARLEARHAVVLAELDAAGRGHELQPLVRALVAPFAEEVDGHWVRFVARLHEDPRFSPFAGGERSYAMAEGVMSATREITARIRTLLDLPAEDADARFFVVVTMAVHAVADRQGLVAADVGQRVPTAERLVEALVDAAVAVFSR